MSDLPVCMGHAQDIWRRVDRSGLSLDHVNAPASQYAEGVGHPVVYYVEVQPGIVKIGTTSNLRSRVMNLRLSFSRVLAAEPGGYPKERFRHVQFADIRIGRREDFRRTEQLEKHMAEIREMFGAPEAVDAEQAAVNASMIAERRRMKAELLGPGFA